eukprot:595381-Rhodomonas_salina.3
MTLIDATTLDANAVSDAWERRRWTNKVPLRLKRGADCSCQSRALPAEQRAGSRAIGAERANQTECSESEDGLECDGNGIMSEPEQCWCWSIS